MNKYLLTFFLLLLIAPELTFAQDSPTLKFVIRVDDILSRNTTILPRSIVPLQDSVSLRGGKITWGVMPHRFLEAPNLDGKLAEELKTTLELGHEVSQHGYIHICQRCGRSSHEMYCTTFNSSFSHQQQTDLVQDGLDLFIEKTEITPSSFIPPGHISDETTYQVLDENGLFIFSDASETKYLTNNVFNLPINDEFTWALTEEGYDENLANALSDIKIAAKESGYYNMMLHDPFIRAGYENGIVLRWMGELLDSLNTYFGNEIEYMTLTEAANSIKGEIVSIDSDFEIPSEISLHQNYPNPFNPTTTISFSLEKPSRVTLKVFDLQGKVVSALINSDYSAGKHSILFNAGDLPSGQYFYSLTSSGITQTKKMTLIK